MRIGVIAASAALGLAALSVVFGSWYTVDQGERGVTLTNGRVTGIAEPGLHFKMPFIDSVEFISVQTHTNSFTDVLSYSKDQQTASIALSVTYRVPPDAVDEVYTQFGSLENMFSRLIERRVNEQTKNIFGQFNAITAIQDRARLNAEVEEAIRKGLPDTVFIESVQIENIDFSDSYEDAINARMLAEVEVQKLKQNAEREKVQAEIVVIQAKAEAEKVRQAATAEADAIRLKGEAESLSISARGKALSANPSVIDLVRAERWNGTVPTTMIPGGAVPFVQLP